MSTLPATAHRAAPSEPAHAQACAVFDDVLTRLRETGWTQFRVDSLTHPNAPSSASHPLAIRTVRYHYTAGEWELFYEYDRNRHPNPAKTRRTVKISAHRTLPTVEQVLSELFGDALPLFR